ncbi:MAG: Uma2 family endonuclease [bacterium]|nr:Uma2 family endonuclease [bacterium]
MELQPLQFEDLPHYTYDDYAQWEGRWEIIRGIPYSMAPSPAKKHQRIGVEILVQLDAFVKNCNRDCATYYEMDWQITEDTVVRPDVLVVCDDNETQTKLEIPPVLVFEILSPSTGDKDRGIKYRLYQEAGVKYYCIVDPTANCAEVFQLNGELYQKEDTFRDGKMIFDINTCRLEMDFAKVFRL